MPGNLLPSYPPLMSRITASVWKTFSWKDVQEDLAILRRYHTVFIVDETLGFWEGEWNQAINALATLIDEVARYNSDGSDVHFVHNQVTLSGVKSGGDVRKPAENVKRGFPQVEASTSLASSLHDMLKPYMNNLKKMRQDQTQEKVICKPVNYIIITNGSFKDQELNTRLRETICATARELEEGGYPFAQVGIQFLVVGLGTLLHEHFLEELDRGLKPICGRDIVDYTHYRIDGNNLTYGDRVKILLGAINKRVDAQYEHRKKGETYLFQK
ncbi:hypothetical protein BV25DRAFT_6148 [Artomyces pyxidatus]|uniref:Uncharacterized protein n=1 Tax=Artomyces pyxidatus TaxID=48021 RepID=A0ACB8TJC4_9AGAM|nr:hypothetical protein BV25DRAFT_6148 [Artomyces pyxidatus]